MKTVQEVCEYLGIELNNIKRFDYKADKDSKKEIVLFAEGNIDIDTDKDFLTEGLMPVHIKAFHTEKNLNNSYISLESAKEALPSIKNRPILARIIELDDGTKHFHEHDMRITESGDIHYIEKCIGVVPESCNATITYDEENQKNFIECDGFIYEEYGNEAADIIKREGSIKVSVELGVLEFHIDVEEEDVVFYIDKFYVSGITCLGKETDGTTIKEGMEGARLDIMKKNFENTEVKPENKKLETNVVENEEKVENAVVDEISVVDADTGEVEVIDLPPVPEDIAEIKEDLKAIRELVDSLQEEVTALKADREEEIIDDLFEDDAYAEIADTEVFANLKNNKANYTNEELKQRLDDAITCFKAGKDTVKNTVSKVSFVNDTERKKSAYGNLFK